MALKADIKFDNPIGIYFSGQNLSGTIELTIDKPRDIRSLCLRIEGYASCQWTEHEHYTRNGKRETRSRTYSGREDYLSTISYLVGSPQSNQITLAPGFHTYRFSCLLPQNLPTSFEGQHGKIRYTCKVSLDRPWKFDLTYKVAFTVLKQQDLNYESPMIRQPVKKEVTKKYFMGIFSSNELYMSVELPISGFVAGQKIDFAIAINNPSGVTVEELKVSLKKIVRYNSDSPRMLTKEVIESCKVEKFPGVPKKSKGNFNLNIVVPPIPPTSQFFCKVINISYELKVKAQVSGIHRSSEIRIPIIIGTVPLNTAFAQHLSHHALQPNMQQIFASAPGMENFVTSTPSAPPPYITQPGDSRDLPPPTYEEIFMFGTGVQIDEEDHHAIGKQLYNPRYPVFNFGNPQPINNNHIPDPALSYGWNENQQNVNEKS